MAHALISRTGARSIARELAFSKGGLQPLVIAGAAAYILLFLVMAVLRAAYAFPIDAIESGALLEVRRILAGEPIYAAPTLAYVPFVYGPVYFYVAALASRLVGADFLALRVVSLLASLVSLILLTLIVRRETHTWTIPLLASGLLAACAPLVEGALDSGRMDALALCLVLAAVYALQRASVQPLAGWQHSASAGCLMGLAVLTKQTSAPVALALALAVALIARRQLAPFAIALLAILGLGLIPLMVQSGRWPLFYLWELPRQHTISPALLWRFWDDLLTRYTLPLLFGVGYLVECARTRDRRRLLFYGALGVGMLGAAWASRSNSGGARNVDLPAYAALSILFALALDRLLERVPRSLGTRRSYVLGLALAQLVVMINNPRALVPYLADTWAGERLESTLTALPGPIFAPSFTGYSDAPDAVQPDLGAVMELMGAYGGPITPEGSRWLQDYGAALAARRFTTVVVDPDFPAFFVPNVAGDNGYVPAGPLFPSTDEFWRWRSGRTPQANLYRPPAS